MDQSVAFRKRVDINEWITLSFNHESRQTPYQGVQPPKGMKFPDFSRLRLNSNVVRDCLGRSGSMLPQKIFKIRMLRLAENEFHTTKFPDFSLTFLDF